MNSLWNIAEDTFRALVEPQVLARRPGEPAEADAVRVMAGDGLVADPAVVLMRSLEIDAGPADVWPWLAQMMRGAGLYGWPELESSRCRSADYLLEGVSPPRAGDRVGHRLELAIVEPGCSLVWRVDPETRVLGHVLSDLTLDYGVVPEGTDRCRLLVRIRAADRHLTSRVIRHLVGVVDFVLPAAQLPRLKDHVESYRRRLAAGDVNRGRVHMHQDARLERGREQEAAAYGPSRSRD